jgi:hypothetical protein
MDRIGNILVVTDEAESTRKGVLAIVTTLFDKRVKVVKAGEFEGTELLAADFCFFGCARPAPASFAYFEKVMRRINLSLRSCAVFSPKPDISGAAADYLTGLVKDSGVKLAGKVLAGAAPDTIKGWAAEIINRER